MRPMLFLLGGFAVVLILGFWMANSMVPPSPSAAAIATTGQSPSSDSTSLWLFAVLAWATAFFVRPLWLSATLTAGVVFVGGVFVVLGALNGYADSHLRPNYSGSWTVFQVGVLMLASRVVTFLLWLRKASLEELM
ncbi:hypothetical protein M2650_12980 [Luteimonas sp. SX5]|uniref:DUF4175 domain-containing protein n=1 Tax=Luteimonas galliterrae TaxID=2940486 RepID=A0ABT0MKX3_9GAMM|nr:hypothetical protein [Luteimonas galliterrae]MCL1635536.1 hypothetical protein [Luteimonas galliterrae]